MNERKVIAHRAMLMIDRPHAIVNLGIGMPEVISQMFLASFITWDIISQVYYTASIVQYQWVEE